MGLEKLSQTAEKAARAAGTVMREYLDKPNQVTKKGFRDLVTDADIAAQKTITNTIQEAYPTHGFLTEEEDTALPSGGPILWIIDPIDGTTNYSRHLPVFCTSIAAVENNKPIGEKNVLVGVIYDPMRDELFSAVRNGKNTSNNNPLQTSRTHSIEGSIIGHDWNRDPHLRKKTLQIISQLTTTAESIRTFGSAALALAWVAAGRLDGYYNYSLNAWDMAASSLMIVQAGGKISTMSGKEPDFSNNKQIDCIAGNAYLHDSLLSLVPTKVND